MGGGKIGLADIPPMGARHKTLSEEVLKVLSNAILSGALKEGERLNESELADRMGISRAPVREALAELTNQGLAVQIPRKGTFVAEWKKQDLWEVATLRSVLEGMAARLACSNAKPADIHHLEDIIKQMEVADQEGDVKQLVNLALMFHSYIWKCSGHKQLQRVLESMRLLTKFFMIVAWDISVEGCPDRHRVLLEAICSRDPEVAEQTAVEHVRAPLLVLEGMSDDHVWQRLRSFAARG